MKMEILSTVDAKYFILDVVPVKESLMSMYEKLCTDLIINNDCFRYVDLSDGSFSSPRIQFVFDISDGKNVYLTKFDACGYINTSVFVSPEDTKDEETGHEIEPVKYNIHLKVYPSDTKAALVWDSGNIRTVRGQIPEQIIYVQSGVKFDDYINLEIENGVVTNLSNEEFFKEIEKLYNKE